MEILYCYDDQDQFSVLLQAPCEWANNWFASEYDTTLTVEYTDHVYADVNQHYLPQPPNDWLAQLPADNRSNALEKFVQFCINITMGSSISFW